MTRLPISIKDMTREQRNAYHRDKQKKYRERRQMLDPDLEHYPFFEFKKGEPKPLLAPNEKLFIILRRRNMTATDFARKLNVTRAMVNNWLSHKYSMPRYIMTKLDDLLRESVPVPRPCAEELEKIFWKLKLPVEGPNKPYGT